LHAALHGLHAALHGLHAALHGLPAVNGCTYDSVVHVTPPRSLPLSPPLFPPLSLPSSSFPPSIAALASRSSAPSVAMLRCVGCVFDQIAMSARYCERLGMRIHWAWCVVRASPTYRQSRCRAAVRVAALVCERHRCNSAPLHHWTYIFTPRSHRPLADAFYPMCPPNEL